MKESMMNGLFCELKCNLVAFYNVSVLFWESRVEILKYHYLSSCFYPETDDFLQLSMTHPCIIHAFAVRIFLTYLEYQFKLII